MAEKELASALLTHNRFVPLALTTLQDDGYLYTVFKTRVAVDLVGAGEGDRVLVIDEGNSGRQLTEAPDAPVKTLIVGFVDAIEMAGEVVFDHRHGDIQ